MHVIRMDLICSPRSRKRLADGLERVVAQAEAPRPTPSARTAVAPIAREDVHGARTLMLDLARRLRSPEPVDPEGVLLLRRLLSDPASPLSSHNGNGSLFRALLEADAALTPRAA